MKTKRYLNKNCLKMTFEVRLEIFFQTQNLEKILPQQNFIIYIKYTDRKTISKYFSLIKNVKKIDITFRIHITF